jgi:DNA invertase Pin-like site-specific DNA recombinase
MRGERMNVLKPEKRAAVTTLLTNGVSQREIKRKTRIDRKTIRRYGRIHGLIAPAAGSKFPLATGAGEAGNAL